MEAVLICRVNIDIVSPDQLVSWLNFLWQQWLQASFSVTLDQTCTAFRRIFLKHPSFCFSSDTFVGCLVCLCVSMLWALNGPLQEEDSLFLKPFCDAFTGR